jgi:hypothetical protein
MLQPGSGGAGEEQREVADDEIVIVRSTQLAGQPVIREPQFRPCLPRVLGDGSRGSEPGRERRPSYGPAESLRTGRFGRRAPILPAVVASPTPGVVASAHLLVEVGSTVAAVVLVAEATRGCRRCIPRAPGVDRGFPHESGSRDAMLRGYPCLREAELSARRTATSSRRFLSSPWIRRPSVLDLPTPARCSAGAAQVVLLPHRAWPASRGFARAVRPDPPAGTGTTASSRRMSTRGAGLGGSSSSGIPRWLPSSRPSRSTWKHSRLGPQSSSPRLWPPSEQSERQ